MLPRSVTTGFAAAALLALAACGGSSKAGGVTEGATLPSNATTTSVGATTTTAPTPTTVASAGNNGGGGGGGGGGGNNNGGGGGGGGGQTHTTNPPAPTTTTLPPANILDFSVSPGVFVCPRTGAIPKETANLHYSVTNTAQLKISGSGAAFDTAVRDAANGTYSVQVDCDGSARTFTLTATAPSGSVTTKDTTVNEIIGQFP